MTLYFNEMGLQIRHHNAIEGLKPTFWGRYANIPIYK